MCQIAELKFERKIQSGIESIKAINYPGLDVA